MNRIGSMFFPEESLKIVLAVIVVAGIVLAGFLLVGKFRENNEQRNAQKFIDSILNRYARLEVGENNTFIFQGFRGGGNWYLTGWSDSNPARPQKCFFAPCLCICKKGSISLNCQLDGFCRNLSEPPVVSAAAVESYTSNPSGTGGGGPGLPVLRTPSCISVGDGVLALNLSRTETSFSVYSSVKNSANAFCAF
ncbi:MAG: hypothetical protein AABX53_02120 [Nanoarchaeota archaeon]